MNRFQPGDTVYLCNPTSERPGIVKGSQWKVVVVKVGKGSAPVMYECQGSKGTYHLREDELCSEDEDIERETADPLMRKLLEAPEDDEPETEDERAAVAEAEEDFKSGRVFSHEELKREFGLSPGVSPTPTGHAMTCSPCIRPWPIGLSGLWTAWRQRSTATLGVFAVNREGGGFGWANGG